MNSDILNINVISLKNSILSLKNSIKNTTTKQLPEKITNNNIWQADAKANLKKALEKLNNTHYADLNKEISRIESAIPYIEKYQNLNSANIGYKNQINNLNPYLYYYETHTVTTYFFGKKSTREERVRMKDYGVERQISALEEKISNNTREMETIKSNINNLIY